MKSEEDSVRCTLAVVALTDVLRAEAALKYLEEKLRVRIIYRKVAPRGTKLLIRQESGHPIEAAKLAEGP